MIFIGMAGEIDYNDPLFKYTTEEKRNMSREEYCALIEESNEYTRKQFGKLNEQKRPKFNTIEELRAYYHCMPIEEAVNNLNKLFNPDD